MRVLVCVLLGVWSLVWSAFALTALGRGDVLGVIAFGLIAGIPWMWITDVLRKVSGSN